jgi:hypothetical protein
MEAAGAARPRRQREFRLAYPTVLHIYLCFGASIASSLATILWAKSSLARDERRSHSQSCLADERRAPRPAGCSRYPNATSARAQQAIRPVAASGVTAGAIGLVPLLALPLVLARSGNASTVHIGAAGR